MNAELNEDLQAQRLQFLLTELGSSWAAPELRALLIDLAHEFSLPREQQI